jgi:hypothetical protein
LAVAAILKVSSAVLGNGQSHQGGAVTLQSYLRILLLKLMLMGSATSDALVLAKTWTAQRATKEIAVKTCIIGFSKLLPDVVVVL